MEQPLLQVNNLRKAYGDNVVLRDLSLTVRQGEVTVIIGPSGCGKSTLLRCLNGLEDIQAGEILLEGQPLRRDAKDICALRQKIGMVFQSYDLFPHLTVLENILLAPMKVQKRKRAEAEREALALLERVGLADRRNDYPRQLSGGQKQRIAIARALASDPEVLLCDEATSALDPQTTNSILNLLQTISRERGITVILITHQMSVIEQICNRVAILDSGVVAEIGDVEQVFSNPQSAAGRRLVSPDVALPLSTWVGPVARIAFNGNTSEEPIIAEVAMEKGIKLSILGADTRNVDGKAFGTMLVSLPEDAEKKQEVLDYLNHFDGVTAEVIQ